MLIENKINIWNEKSNKLIIDLTEMTGGLYITIIEALYIILGDISLFAETSKNYNHIFTQPIWRNIKDSKILDYLEVFRGSKLKYTGK